MASAAGVGGGLAGFVVEGADGAARAGRWGSVATPAFTLPTQSGQPIHLLREAAARVSVEAAGIAAVRYTQLWGHDVATAARGATLAAYTHLAPRAALLTLRDPASMAAKPEASDDAVNVTTHLGRRRLAVDDYISGVVAMRPEAAVGVADEVPVSVGQNRLRLSAARGDAWLAQQVAALIRATGGPPPPLPPPAIPLTRGGAVASTRGGGDGGSGRDSPPAAKVARAGTPTSSVHDGARPASPVAAAAAAPAARLLAVEEAPRMLAHVSIAANDKLRSPLVAGTVAAAAAANRAWRDTTGAGSDIVVGYALGGLGMGEAGEVRAALLPAVVGDLPPAGVRLVTGLVTASELLAAGAGGVDVVDSQYAAALTAAGRAAAFRLSPADVPAAAGATRLPTSLHIASPEFVDDAARLAPGCTCLACAGVPWEAVAHLPAGRAADPAPGAAARPRFVHAPTTRAYVHHLLVAHEMTAQVLLQSHNVTAVAALAAACRDAIRAGTFTAFRAWFDATHEPEDAAALAAAATGTAVAGSGGAAAGGGGRELVD